LSHRADRHRPPLRPGHDGLGTAQLCLGIVLLAAAVRIGFALALPMANGDWVLYGNVARNILGGCGVAVSLPGQAGCTPHFGGNQLPLYPAFIAGIWALLGPSEPAIRIVQGLLAALSCGWLALAVGRWTGSRWAMALTGALLAVSPVQAVWTGFLLTETLALASTQWVLAELLFCLAAARLRVLPLSLSLIVAVWVRMDSVLLLVPMAAVAIGLGGLRQGMRRAALVTALVAAPCLLWAGRNLAVGIPPLPQEWTLPNGAPMPPGYMRWFKGWVVTEQERAGVAWFDAIDYHRIRVAEAAYRSPAERARVEALLARLRRVSGQPFPAEIDAAFARLAAERQAATSLGERARRDLARAGELARRWVWPWRPGPGGPRTVLTPNDAYRLALSLGFAAVAVAALARRDPRLSWPVGLTLLYALSRLGLLAITGNIEDRYMAQIAPFIEATLGAGCGLAAQHVWRRHQRPAKAR